MPILRDAEGELTQGDILKGVVLHTTSSQWDTPVAERRKSELCMVISRPCAALNDPTILVAAIGRRNDSPPKEANTFEKVLDFLKTIRDGERAIDRFYLGQIPHEPSGRYYAELNSIHTIGIPKNGLNDLVSRHRIFGLSDDFVRDLHLRLFRAFVRMGFDDHMWMNDNDLDWLIEAGKHEIQSILAADQLAGVSASASGARPTDAAAQRMNLENRMKPYVAEKTRRSSGNAATTDDTAEKLNPSQVADSDAPTC